MQLLYQPQLNFVLTLPNKQTQLISNIGATFLPI